MARRVWILPVAPLLRSRHPAIEYWTHHDLEEAVVAPAAEMLWDLPIPRRLVRAQQGDGSWRYPGKRARGATDYDLLETYRQLGFLIEMFGFTREHPAVGLAASFVFARQTLEGDIRGIYGAQYSHNYTGALVELLVKAGLADDERTHAAFAWLEAIRQRDGG